MKGDSSSMFDSRIAAIKCIMSLEYVHDAVEPDDIVLRHQVADEVFVLLPKVVFTLTQVATGDDTQGHALIAVSILREKSEHTFRGI